MLERNILSSFFFSQLIELFHRTMKKIENPAEYELFVPKPLTLTCFDDVFNVLWHWKSYKPIFGISILKSICLLSFL